MTLRLAGSVEELDVLEPVWLALQEHHGRVTPSLGEGTPKREAAESWRIRRSKYERWLSDPDTFFIVAEADGGAIGYAFVTIGPGHASWETGPRIAELETLAVLAGHRGEGVGTALVDAAWDRLAELGVDEMEVTTTITNLDSHGFYESRGFERRFVVYFAAREPRR